MRFWEKTLTVGRKKCYAFRLGVAAAAVVVFCWSMNVCLHAGGVIPLSTRIPVEGLEQNPPTVEQVQNPPKQDLDEELLNLLRNSSVKGGESPQWKVVRMRVTAYCACPHCCGKSSDGLTANMHKIHQGDVFVAADKRIPFGTEIIISGYNQERPVEVKDRGRLIYGNRLDVFFNNHQVAKKWGAKYLDVLVKVQE